MHVPMTIDLYRLVVLMNELYRGGDREFALFSPFYSEPLFAFRLEAESGGSTTSLVKLMVSYRKYADFVNSIKDPFVARELPSFGDLRSMLVQAGIVPYPNFGKILKLLQELCTRDFLRGDRPAYLALDTNLLRDRFYSAQFHLLEHLTPNRVGCAISPYVKDELEFDRRKYKSKDVQRFRSQCADRRLRDRLEDFFNQNSLKDRLCRLAFAELEKAKRIHWIELIPELDDRELEGSPDLNIIKSYKLAAVERGADFYLLSRDDGFVAHAEGIPGIFPFFVESPKSKKDLFEVATWEPLCQLMYVCAVANGMVRLQAANDQLLLLGIWKGKNSANWRREELIVEHLSGTGKAFARACRDWEILEHCQWSPPGFS